MMVVKHGKCKKCGSVRHIAAMEPNVSGIGLVCKDKTECTRNASKNRPGQIEKPTSPMNVK